MTARQATVETVAALAKVSAKTVSRVINNESNVKESTREKVKKAIELLNFRPRRAARQLRGSKNYSIAIIYEPPGSEFLNGVMEGIFPVCDDADYHVLLEPMPMGSKQKYIERFIARRHVDGAILLPPESENLHLINELEKYDIKCVLIESSVNGFNKIEIENEEAGFTVGNHLLGLGHRRFGYISLSQDRKNGNKRLTGFKKAIQAAQIPEGSLAVQQGDCSFESGYECARVLLSNEIPPTAIFAGNDRMAVGAIACAREMGVKVPSDLSVCGFDNTEISRIFSPQLTTVTEPLHDYGMIAATMLLECIEAPENQTNHKVLKAEFVPRNSTQRLKTEIE